MRELTNFTEYSVGKSFRNPRSTEICLNTYSEEPLHTTCSNNSIPGLQKRPIPEKTTPFKKLCPHNRNYTRPLSKIIRKVYALTLDPPMQPYVTLTPPPPARTTKRPYTPSLASLLSMQDAATRHHRPSLSGFILRDFMRVFRFFSMFCSVVLACQQSAIVVQPACFSAFRVQGFAFRAPGLGSGVQSFAGVLFRVYKA